MTTKTTMTTSTIQKVDFKKFNLPIPESLYQLPLEKQEEMVQYFEQMDDLQKKAYQIAYQHLGTSFHILKSNGFKEWKKLKTS